MLTYYLIINRAGFLVLQRAAHRKHAVAFATGERVTIRLMPHLRLRLPPAAMPMVLAGPGLGLPNQTQSMPLNFGELTALPIFGASTHGLILNGYADWQAVSCQTVCMP